MTGETWIVFGVLGGMLALFASDRIRLDMVALLALLALGVTGILSPAQALAGFADPIVLMIAGLFVVGEGLFRTGVAQRVGRFTTRVAGESEVRLLVVVMLAVALLSAFMSSTGTVAVMIPVVLSVAWGRGIPPSRLLIPLAMGSMLGGMLTLIGTPPNIVVSNQLEASGRDPFGFFSFTPVGLAVVGVGVLFMALLGRHLLPDRPAPHALTGEGGAHGSTGPETSAPSTTRGSLAREYGVSAGLFEVRVDDNAALAGRSLEEAALRSLYGVTVVEVLRGDRSLSVVPSVRFRGGDVLRVHGAPEAMLDLVAAERLSVLAEPEEGEEPGLSPEVGLVEVLLTPRSRLLGKSLGDLGFRERYRVTVLSLLRMGKPTEGRPWEVPLRFGDTLLVKGPWPHIRRLQQEREDFVVASDPPELDPGTDRQGRAPLALGVVLVMMGLLTFEVIPAAYAVLLAAVAMVMSGCVEGEEAYRSVNWQSVILIAAVLPVATALEATGGMDVIVTGMEGVLGDAGPLAALAAVMVLTSVLSQLISNTASAVLLAPVALQLADGLATAPEPFLMGIAVAASTAFATPIASPVNTLVLSPGGYRFGDFLKVGVALQAVVLTVALAVVPLLFPF